MTSAALQPGSASISLPPISSIEFHTQILRRSSPEVVQPPPPPPPQAPRVLPPLPYPYAARPAPPPPPPPHMHHGYIDTRPLYPGIPSSYQPMPGRMPLPSSTDPNLIVHQPRHKAKEVKRRTKTGCLTCRKRRIKVSLAIFLFLSICKVCALEGAVEFDRHLMLSNS
ncbi:hypothetical protein EDD37DRAFT_645382 [Exophiala viscosa]|uniref:uncharacterized protein n=1 Tax=Exophiala viscosa TaxID=2486360 RepID=UPI002198295B|nr:hypothetical protein EDD37DRAFT_645382 [Exophiala viscosa]